MIITNPKQASFRLWIDSLRPLNDEGRRALKHMREALADLHDSVKRLQKLLRD